MPVHNFIRRYLPTPADVIFALNTIHERSDDLSAGAREDQLARTAEEGNARLRLVRIISTVILLVTLALCAVYLIAQTLAL